MNKIVRNNRNNFYNGCVLERRSIYSDGVKSVVICVYNTIAYKDNENVYYDFLLQKQLKCYIDDKEHPVEFGEFYFLPHSPYFKKTTSKKIKDHEGEKLYSDIYNLGQEESFLSPEKVQLVRE